MIINIEFREPVTVGDAILVAEGIPVHTKGVEGAIA